MGIAGVKPFRAVVGASVMLALTPAFAQTEGQWLTLRGLVDARFILTDTHVGWESGALGKTRYGANATGDAQAIARIAEASLVARADLTWDLSAHAHLIAGSQQSNTVDVAEAFLTYKPAPEDGWNLSARAGAFFPPISLENTGLAWTSPFTITPSAINSWVGEELKTIGPEVTATWQSDAVSVSVLGAGFVGNDPAGTELTWRGWALHDRKAGLFERLPLAQVRIIRPNAPRPIGQAPYDQPIDEIDDRIGYYLGARLTDVDDNRIEFLRYDNRADDTIINRALQWAWDTRFWSAGGRATVSGDIDIVGQIMWGTTSIITFPPAPSVVKVDYDSAFLLVSKAWDRHRVSGRVEYFKTHDRDTSPDDNSETGRAVTLAYIFRPFERQRLTLELLHVHSRRPERTLSFGLPATANETQIQASYRYFF